MKSQIIKYSAQYGFIFDKFIPIYICKFGISENSSCLSYAAFCTYKDFFDQTKISVILNDGLCKLFKTFNYQILIILQSDKRRLYLLCFRLFRIYIYNYRFLRRILFISMAF